MNKPITLHQALEWEISRKSLIGSWWLNNFGSYEKFAKKVAKRYNHYIQSNLYYQQEQAVKQVKEIIKQLIP